MTKNGKSTAGATRTSRTSASDANRRIRNRNRGAAESADWGSASAEQILRTIRAITACGCAVQFGYTQDYGSYRLRVVGDGDPYDEYIRPTEDVDTALEGIALDFEDYWAANLVNGVFQKPK